MDEHGRAVQLVTTVSHRPDCAFGPGFFRLSFGTRDMRYCQSELEVQRACALLQGVAREIKVERDGYCLDGLQAGDANTPDVIDGEQWLSMAKPEGMRVLGLTREADYLRVYNDIEAAVLRRDNRASQGGVRASIVIKRPGAAVVHA